jgi:hypothetical protein
VNGTKIFKLYQVKKKLRRAWYLNWRLATDISLPIEMRQSAIEAQGRMRAHYIEIRERIANNGRA